MEFIFYILGEWNILFYFEFYIGILYIVLGNIFVGLILVYFLEDVKMICSVLVRFEIFWNLLMKGSGCLLFVVYGLLMFILLFCMIIFLGLFFINSE